MQRPQGPHRSNNRGDVSITAEVHPEGDSHVECAAGEFLAYANALGDPEPLVGVIEVEPTTMASDDEPLLNSRGGLL